MAAFLLLAASSSLRAADPQVTVLPSAVVDAEFDAAHGRMAVVTATPARLYRWDAASRALASIDLADVPTCVSISPDGATAVVGHNGRVTRVDLAALTLTGSWTSGADALDIVHGGNGFAYVFPRGSGWAGISCLDLRSGALTSSGSGSIYGTLARLRPGSSTIYGANNYISPDDIQRFGIAAGTAQVERDSPYHGDYPMGGNLWFNDQGTRILTRSGRLFLATDTATTDMTYAGRLPFTSNLVWADHGGAGAGMYATIVAGDETRLALVDAERLVLTGSRTLPPQATASGASTSRGRWAFLSADGLAAHVVARADLTGDHAIVSFDLTPQPGVAIASPATAAVLGGSFPVTFSTTAWPPPTGGSVRWRLDGADQGLAASPLPVSGLTPGDHTIQIYLADHLGAATGAAAAVAVRIMPNQPGVLRLATDVVDAEFHAASGGMVLVSATPPQIHLWSSASGSLISRDLPTVPTCVSISPDGSSAVVGHDGRVTAIALPDLAQTGSWTCSAVALDIVHGGNGFAYVFPLVDQWDAITCIDLATGAVASSGAWSIYAGTLARLRPGSSTIYGANNGVSPDDLERYGIGGGTAVVERNSPYHGDYPMGGNLWFNDQGTRILTRSGRLFLATDTVATDMTYAGRLPFTGNLVWADHGGAGAGMYAAIVAGHETRLTLVDANRFETTGTWILPPQTTASGLSPISGRWAFLAADGLTAHVVARAADITGQHVIITIDLTSQPGVTIVSPANFAILGGSFPVSFTTTAWPPPAGGSVRWRLDGADQGLAISPLPVSGLAPGAHIIQIYLADHLGAATGVTAMVTIQVMPDQPGVLRLATDVVDAEFHAASGRMVLVSASPPQIHLWSSASGSLVSRDLPAVPTCVSISPDGNSAVVGHDGRVTAIALPDLAQTGSWTCSSVALDIVHGGNGFAYVFPLRDQWEAITCIDLATGEASSSGGWSIYAGTLARLRPGSLTIYGADNGLSPSDIERYGIAAGTAQVERDSPYHGDYPMGGNLWFNDQGTRILTRSGRLFLATDVVATDMTYAGRLPTASNLVWADHGGPGAGIFATIESSNDQRLGLMDGSLSTLLATRSLPTLTTTGSPAAVHGRWVFLSADGNSAHVVEQADAAAGLVNRYAIATVEINAAASVAITSPATGAALTGSFPVTFRTTGWPPIQGGSVGWSLDGVAQGPAANPLQVSGLAPGGHHIRIDLLDRDGAATGRSSAIGVQVVAVPPGIVLLPTDVVDAEYDAANGRMALVSAQPAQFHRWTAANGALASLDLPGIPTCVALSSDGATAVVGHDRLLSIINVATMAVSRNWPCAVAVGDVALGGNGFAYVFPGPGGGDRVRCINLSNGADTAGSGSVPTGMRARIRPVLGTLFGVNPGTDPPGIQRFDLAGGLATLLGDAFNSTPSGGDCWFTDQGDALLMRTGQVYRVAGSVLPALTYAGTIPAAGPLVQADHGGPGAGTLAVLASADPAVLRLVGLDSLAVTGSRSLPSFPTISGPVPARGRWAFVSADGRAAHVVMQADPAARLVNDQAIVSLDLTALPTVAITSPATGAVLGGSFPVSYRTTGWPPPAGGSAVWNLDGARQGTATSPLDARDLAPGRHSLRIDLLDASGAAVVGSAAVEVQVVADQPGTLRLAGDVVDAEYSSQRGTLVLVGAVPPRIQRWSSSTGALAALDLPRTPTCVGVSPDGATAVVGHDGRVTVVDLATMSLGASWVSGAAAGDIVHDGAGHALVFPAPGGDGCIHAVDLANGGVATGGSVNPGTRARLRPGTTQAYGTADTAFPAALGRYGLSAGSPALLRTDPYHGEHAMGGDLWIDRQGTRILTRTGNLFRASDDAATDMTLAGTLPVAGNLVWADHGGRSPGWFASIVTGDDTRLALSNADLLDLAATRALPALTTPDGSCPVHGRWVFLSADGATAHVVARADAAAGLANDQVVVSVELQAPPTLAITSPGAGAVLGGTFPVSFRTTGWPSFAGGSVSWSLDGAPQGPATSPIQVAGLAPGRHSVRVELTDRTGSAIGVAGEIPVQVLADHPGTFRLAGEVADAEFHAGTGRLVLVAANPPQLHRWSAADGRCSTIDLPVAPTCVGLSPDGEVAVIGHDRQVTVVDLATMAVARTWPCAISVGDLVHGGDGHAYALLRTGPATAIRCLDLATGGEAGGDEVPGGAQARLRPASAMPSLYCSAADGIRRYDLTGGVARLAGLSPGGRGAGTNLWLDDLGTAILSSSGGLLRAADADATDLAWAGQIVNGALQWADHGGPEVGWFAAIATGDDGRILVARTDLPGLSTTAAIPTIATPAGEASCHGRFVFLAADGRSAYVVARADAGDGSAQNHVIVTMTVAPPQAPPPSSNPTVVPASGSSAPVLPGGGSSGGCGLGGGLAAILAGLAQLLRHRRRTRPPGSGV